MATREEIIAAVTSKVAGAYAWKVPLRRRVKLWADVPVSDRPCCFIYEGGHDPYSWSNLSNVKRYFNIALVVYTDAHDQDVPGGIEINTILEAIENEFGTPKGSDVVRQANTLGGLVHACRIDGAVLRETGDIDGDGLLLIPLKIILP